MAKKTSKAAKATKASVKSKPAASKAASKKAPPKKAAGKALKVLPKVTTGKGASTAELGGKLVALFNQGKADEWIKSAWNKKVRSIEGDGTLHVGPKHVLEKWAWWMGTTEVLGCTAEGPYVGATGFSVKYVMHCRDRASGKEMHMTEVGVYTVKNGKIVQEEFMYAVA